MYYVIIKLESGKPMSSDARIFNFILYGNFTDEAIKNHMEDCQVNMTQMLRDTYRALQTNVNNIIITSGAR